jgi:hypothetical protein
MDDDVVMVGEKWEGVINGDTTIDICSAMVVFSGTVMVDIVPDFVDGDMVMVGERW